MSPGRFSPAARFSGGFGVPFGSADWKPRINPDAHPGRDSGADASRHFRDIYFAVFRTCHKPLTQRPESGRAKHHCRYMWCIRVCLTQNLLRARGKDGSLIGLTDDESSFPKAVGRRESGEFQGSAGPARALGEYLTYSRVSGRLRANTRNRRNTCLCGTALTISTFKGIQSHAHRTPLHRGKVRRL